MRMLACSGIGGLLVVATVSAFGWGSSPDSNCDGCVDLRDYATMQTAFTGPGCEGGIPYSYFLNNVGFSRIIVAAPGTNGFLIKDIVINGPPGQEVRLSRYPDGQYDFFVCVIPDSGMFAVNFESGLVLQPGASLYVWPEAKSPAVPWVNVMLTGKTF